MFLILVSSWVAAIAILVIFAVFRSKARVRAKELAAIKEAAQNAFAAEASSEQKSVKHPIVNLSGVAEVALEAGLPSHMITADLPGYANFDFVKIQADLRKDIYKYKLYNHPLAERIHAAALGAAVFPTGISTALLNSEHAKAVSNQKAS